MSKIIVDAENPYYCSIDGVLFTHDLKTLVRYPMNKAGQYYSVPEGVEIIAESAFHNCTQLKHVTLPGSIERIGDYAFSETELLTLELPAKPVSIGEAAIRPASYYRYGGKERILIDALNAKKTLNGRNDYHLQIFIEMYSGMRMGEINALRVKDIDINNNIVHVHSTISRGVDSRPFVKDTTKTYAGLRDVPISKKLKPYLIEAVRKYQPNPEGLLFYDHIAGSVITTSQVNSFFQRVCENAGLPKLGQHALRHTFATRCIESGIPAVVLKTWLGHKDIHVTLDTYTDIFKAMDNGALEKFDAYIDAM